MTQEEPAGSHEHVGRNGSGRGEPHAGDFVDIHCHILPGIDDGARDRAEALQMARIAQEADTRLIVTTPHNFPRTERGLLDEARHRVDLLQKAVIEEGIRLSLRTGQEVRVTRSLSAQASVGEAVPLGETRYMLTEPPFTSLPDYVYEELEAIIAAGFRPVMAHPERNRVIQNDPDIVRRFIAMGVLTQINTGSLLGHYGPQSLEAGRYLLKRQLAHVLATDAHGATGNRVPNMRAGYDAASVLVGQTRALALTRDNPVAITEGRDVPYRPDTSSPAAAPPEPPSMRGEPDTGS